MIQLVRTDSENVDFTSLVVLLDQDLAIRDGDEHAFYAQFNKTNHIKNVVLPMMVNMPLVVAHSGHTKQARLKLKECLYNLVNAAKGLHGKS